MTTFKRFSQEQAAIKELESALKISDRMILEEVIHLKPQFEDISLGFKENIKNIADPATKTIVINTLFGPRTPEGYRKILLEAVFEERASGRSWNEIFYEIQKNPEAFKQKWINHTKELDQSLEASSSNINEILGNETAATHVRPVDIQVIDEVIIKLDNSIVRVLCQNTTPQSEVELLNMLGANPKLVNLLKNDNVIKWIQLADDGSVHMAVNPQATDTIKEGLMAGLTLEITPNNVQKIVTQLKQTPSGKKTLIGLRDMIAAKLEEIRMRKDNLKLKTIASLKKQFCKDEYGRPITEEELKQKNPEKYLLLNEKRQEILSGKKLPKLSFMQRGLVSILKFIALGVGGYALLKNGIPSGLGIAQNILKTGPISPIAPNTAAKPGQQTYVPTQFKPVNNVPATPAGVQPNPTVTTDDILRYIQKGG